MECAKSHKSLDNLQVLQECLGTLYGRKWIKAYREKPVDACQRIIDVLHYQDLREMAFEFMLACDKFKQREIAKNWLEIARTTLQEDSDVQRRKIQRVMDITKNFEAAAAADVAADEAEKNVSADAELDAEVPEDLRDDNILEQLSADFNFATPSIATPRAAANAAAAAAAVSASAAVSAAADTEAPSVAAAAEASSVAEEDSSATAKPFVYRVDSEFKEEPHWEKSRRGTSGFKYVTIDETKAKPWRVKVCALLYLCPCCALICLCPNLFVPCDIGWSTYRWQVLYQS